jgi:hypothetical protein
LRADTGRESLKTPGMLSLLRPPEKRTDSGIMIKNDGIRVNDYSAAAAAGENGKIPFDKRKIIANLGEILMDREEGPKKRRSPCFPYLKKRAR